MTDTKVTLQDQVDALIKKAVDSFQSDEALRFSQAALNIAHTKDVMVDKYLGTSKK